MTQVEAYNSLRRRVEWQMPLDDAFSYLSFDTPESGRFLQEEHPSVRIPIIYETLFDVDISESDFGSKLEELKKKAILQMLHDVFYDQKEINSDWIDDYIGLFDYAIILKHSINVMFEVMNSTRVNLTNAVSKENLQRWFIDLNGLKDTTNGIYTPGFSDRYRREVKRIREVLFLKRRTLKVVTAK